MNVIGETVKEATETFYVNLTNVAGVDIADSEATGTIVNDDGKGKPTSLAAVTLRTADVRKTSAARPRAAARPSPAARVVDHLLAADLQAAAFWAAFDTPRPGGKRAAAASLDLLLASGIDPLS